MDFLSNCLLNKTGNLLCQGLEKEILFQNDMENLIGKRPFKSSHLDLNVSNNQEDNDSNNQVAKNEEDRTSTEEE